MAPNNDTSYNEESTVRSNEEKPVPLGSDNDVKIETIPKHEETKLSEVKKLESDAKSYEPESKSL